MYSLTIPTVGGGPMNFQQRGAVLINQLKELVIEVLQTHPEAGPESQGISQRELARSIASGRWSWIIPLMKC